VSAELCGSVYGCEYHGVEALGGDEGYVVLIEGRDWAEQMYTRVGMPIHVAVLDVTALPQ